jgi:hypothetical protein
MRGGMMMKSRNDEKGRENCREKVQEENDEASRTREEKEKDGYNL